MKISKRSFKNSARPVAAAPQGRGAQARSLGKPTKNSAFFLFSPKNA